MRHFPNHVDGVLDRASDTDILYMNVFGADMLIVSSVEAAIDLFERKSSTYADRVCSVFWAPCESDQSN